MNFISLSMVAVSLLASAHFSTIDVKSMTQDNPAYNIDAVSVPANAESVAPISRTTVEDVVKDYFKDIPVLVKVAECESEFRQVDANGAILRGIKNPFDVGVMQINEKYHLSQSEQVGLDIYSLKGNLEYARALYNESGTAPWSASEPCWANL